MVMEIVWPLEVNESLIERWFIEAVTDGLISPERLNSPTTEEMAFALDSAGIICLKVNS
jgi:hypothetical protein